MRSEVRVGRRVGTGSVITLTTANQPIGGLSVTLDVPKGCAGLVTLAGLVVPVNASVFVYLEVDGVVQSPPSIAFGTNVAGGYLSGAQTYWLTPGRHGLRVLAAVNVAGSSQIDPVSWALSWIIAPQGGIAN